MSDQLTTESVWAEIYRNNFAVLGMVDLTLLVYLFIFYLIAYFVIASLLAAIGAAPSPAADALR